MSDNTAQPTPNRKSRRHPEKPAPTFIGIPETATYLNVSTRMVRELIAAGALRAYRIGGKTIRIRREDVESVLSPIPAGI